MYIEISKNGMKIICTEFPYRKKLGLGIAVEPNGIAKCATFNNEESAEEFMEYLAKFVGAERK